MIIGQNEQGQPHRGALAAFPKQKNAQQMPGGMGMLGIYWAIIS